MILYQRIWLEENKAIELKYVNYDFTLDLSTFTLEIKRNQNKRKQGRNERNLDRSAFFVRDPELKILHSQKRYLYSWNSSVQLKKRREKIKIVTYVKKWKFLQQ